MTVIANVPVTARQEAALCMARTLLRQITLDDGTSPVADVAEHLDDLIRTIRQFTPAHQAAMTAIDEWLRDHMITLAELEHLVGTSASGPLLPDDADAQTPQAQRSATDQTGGQPANPPLAPAHIFACTPDESGGLRDQH